MHFTRAANLLKDGINWPLLGLPCILSTLAVAACMFGAALVLTTCHLMGRGARLSTAEHLVCRTATCTGMSTSSSLMLRTAHKGAQAR